VTISSFFYILGDLTVIICHMPVAMIYRVRQNKISERENRDINIMQKYFYIKLPHLFTTYVFMDTLILLN